MTSVLPISNRLPFSTLHVTLGVRLELSVATGSFQTTMTVEMLRSVAIVWSVGQVTLGASVSVGNTITTVGLMRYHMIYLKNIVNPFLPVHYFMPGLRVIPLKRIQNGQLSTNVSNVKFSNMLSLHPP